MQKKLDGSAEGEAPVVEKKKRCFVITPIGATGSTERLHADWVLNAAIKPVFEVKGYEVFRSDTIADPSMINDAIFNHVTDDEICVADLSFLNPNVFYELGVRHAIEKPVIHIAHSAIRLPFDTAQHRAIFFDLTNYHSIEILKQQLADQLDAIEAVGFKVSNPLTHAKGRQTLATSGDSKDQIIADLMIRVEALERPSRQASWKFSAATEKQFLGESLNSPAYVGMTAVDAAQHIIERARHMDSYSVSFIQEVISLIEQYDYAAQKIIHRDLTADAEGKQLIGLMEMVAGRKLSDQATLF